MRRVVLHRLKRAVDRRKHLVVDLHELFRLLERLGVVRHNEGNRVAKIVRQTADGHERILVVLNVANEVRARDIVRRQNCAHAGKRKRLGRVDRFDPCPGVFCADGRAVGHIRHIAVVWVLSVTQHLFLHVQTVDARADLPVGFRGGRDRAALS